jgi:hypothetical protein
MLSSRVIKYNIIRRFCHHHDKEIPLNKLNDKLKDKLNLIKLELELNTKIIKNNEKNIVDIQNIVTFMYFFQIITLPFLLFH